MSRLNPGTVLAGIFAVLFAFAAAYVVRSFLVREPPPQEAAKPAADTTIQVPTASSELLAGRTITLGDLALRPMEIADARKKIEAKEMPADFMTNPEQIVGRILREPVKVGDAFSAALFYPEGTGPTVADNLKPGFRAVTITVTDTGLVSGFASPTTLVDVLFRSEKLDDFPETTSTLIEGAEVLAVGRFSYPNSQNNEQDDRGRVPDLVHATLAVTPEQAGILRVLEGRGEMSLALRSPDERSALTIESDLLAAKGRLSIWGREKDLLLQMEELSVKTGTEFKEQERLATIATEIENVEIVIEGLMQEMEQSRSESRKMTLASVLGIPDPPPPPPPVPGVTALPLPKIELYLRGQRSSVVFDPLREDSSAAPVEPPVSAVSPPAVDGPQATRETAPLDKTTSSVTPKPDFLDKTKSSVAPETAARGQQVHDSRRPVAAPRSVESVPSKVPVAQTVGAPPTAGRPTAGRPTAGRPTAGRPTAGRPAATGARPTATAVQQSASSPHNSPSNVVDARQTDVKLALQQIDQRVQSIQENQERSLARLSEQLQEKLSAGSLKNQGLTGDAEQMTGPAPAKGLQQQEDVRRALQLIDQRMLAMQARNEESLKNLSTQMTAPLPGSEVPGTAGEELQESVNRINKLTGIVESLEARLSQKDTATPVESTGKVPEIAADTQASTDTRTPAAVKSRPAAVELVAGGRSSSRSPQEGTQVGQRSPAIESSRVFVWSPAQGNRKQSASPAQDGKSKIEIFMGSQRTTSSSLSPNDPTL